jgi:hypothetical protein
MPCVTDADRERAWKSGTFYPVKRDPDVKSRDVGVFFFRRRRAAADGSEGVVFGNHHADYKTPTFPGRDVGVFRRCRAAPPHPSHVSTADEDAAAEARIEGVETR